MCYETDCEVVEQAAGIGWPLKRLERCRSYPIALCVAPMVGMKSTLTPMNTLSCTWWGVCVGVCVLGCVFCEHAVVHLVGCVCWGVCVGWWI